MTDDEREAFEAQCALAQRWPAGTRVRVAVSTREYVEYVGRIGVVSMHDNFDQFDHDVDFDDNDQLDWGSFAFSELELVGKPQ